MALFERKSKTRRTPPRPRAAPARPVRPITPPGKGWMRWLMTLLFLGACVAILTYRTSKPPIRVGDIARETYRARVSFEMPDAEATRQAAEMVMRVEPRVFTETRGHLERVPRELERFLFDVLHGRNMEALVPLARANWGVTQEQIERLRAHLTDDWIRAAMPAITRSIRKIGGLGIMDGKRRQEELNAERYDFVALQPDGSRELRKLVGPVEYPDGLAAVLREELRDVPDLPGMASKEPVIDLLVQQMSPTLRWNQEATDAALRRAAAAVEPRTRRISQGSIILDAGQKATRAAVEEIQAEAAEFARKGALYRDREGEGDRIRLRIYRAVGVAVLFLVGFCLLAAYAVTFSLPMMSSNTRIFGVYFVVLLVFAAFRLLEQAGLSLHWTPVVLAAMALTVACGQSLALGVIMLVSLMGAIATDARMGLGLPLAAAGFAAVLSLGRVRSRTDLIEAGVLAAATHLVLIWAAWLTGLIGEGPAPTWPMRESVAAVGGSALAGFVMSGVLPYVERFFDAATDLRLLEWTDQNQPLLRRLAIEAPGSYHHSAMVSSMAEAAAEAIGASALLARTGGYLHDVGKIIRPEYYIENTGGRGTPHDRLSPPMSALILTAHPKDGLDLAREYRVPSPIRRIILEHHGTSLVQYFYSKALEAAKSAGAAVDIETYRYRTPLPQSPESAIVMLADACESAARSLSDASPSGIEKLVHRIVSNRLEDGQLDECGMSVTDIRAVEKSLVRSLTAMAHPRIRYPALPAG